MLDSLLKLNDFLFTSLISNKKVHLFTLIFFVYLCHLNAFYSSDTLPTHLLPVSIILDHDFDLNEFNYMNFGMPLSATYINNRLVSNFPVFSAVLAVPFYLPFVFMGFPVESYFSAGGLYCAFATALSALFLYLTLLELVDERKSLLCSLAYALGTCTWSISSQDFWQHGTSQMFIALSVFFLVKGLRERRFVSYSGFTLACAVASRPSNILIALILSAYILFEHRNAFLRFALFALPPVVFLLSYSWIYFGSFLMLGQGQDPFANWTTPMLYGIVGLLFSPSNGLFPYSPVLIFAFFGISLAWKRDILFKYLAASVFAVLLFWSRWWAWHGANCYGYRMLVDITPLLCLFLAFFLESFWSKRWFRLLFTILLVYSVAVQIVGVLFFDGLWNKQTLLSYPPDRMNPYYWNIGDSQLVYYFKKAFFAVNHLF